jgi:hypothetical protein
MLRFAIPNPSRLIAQGWVFRRSRPTPDKGFDRVGFVGGNPTIQRLAGNTEFARHWGAIFLWCPHELHRWFFKGAIIMMGHRIFISIE